MTKKPEMLSPDAHADYKNVSPELSVFERNVVFSRIRWAETGAPWQRCHGPEHRLHHVHEAMLVRSWRMRGKSLAWTVTGRGDYGHQRKQMLSHMRMRDRTLSSRMAQIIFPVSVSVSLSYNVAGKTHWALPQEGLNNGRRKLFPFLRVRQPKPYGTASRKAWAPV